MVEDKNEHGTVFELYDHTDIAIEADRYLYHFKNKGENEGPGCVYGYIECRYVTEAMVSAPSYVVAIEQLTREHLSDSYANYTFEVQLLGVDLMYSEGDRTIYASHKPPVF